jgi:hypothetical protein
MANDIANKLVMYALKDLILQKYFATYSIIHYPTEETDGALPPNVLRVGAV